MHLLHKHIYANFINLMYTNVCTEGIQELMENIFVELEDDYVD